MSLRSSTSPGLVALVFLAGACSRAQEGSAAAAPYALTCAASNTASTAQVYCVRTDTRDGNVQRVDIFKLPVSNGPTTAAPGPAGRYQTHCAAASTDQRSDFYCVRLNAETGDMMLVNLQKVGELPAK